MKTSILSLLSAALIAGGLTSGGPAAQAQEPVSTGIVHRVEPKAGMLTLRTDQAQRQLTFYGMERANIFTADGKPAQVSDIMEGAQVTVQYATRGNRWYISKVILPNQAPAGAGTTGATAAAGTGTANAGGTNNGNLNATDAARAAGAAQALNPAVNTAPGTTVTGRDGDITTQPGRNAAADGDITTQPGRNAARDGDITTQPTDTGLRRSARERNATQNNNDR